MPLINISNFTVTNPGPDSRLRASLSGTRPGDSAAAPGGFFLGDALFSAWGTHLGPWVWRLSLINASSDFGFPVVDRPCPAFWQRIVGGGPVWCRGYVEVVAAILRPWAGAVPMRRGAE